jgi:hypothetical protein
MLMQPLIEGLNQETTDTVFSAVASPNPLLNSHKSQMSGKIKKSGINYVFKTVYLQENKIEQYRKALEAKILI